RLNGGIRAVQAVDAVPGTTHCSDHVRELPPVALLQDLEEPDPGVRMGRVSGEAARLAPVHDSPVDQLVHVSDGFVRGDSEATRDAYIVGRLAGDVYQGVCSPEIPMHPEGFGEPAPVLDELTLRRGHGPVVI